jgi:L-histidine Nalpha-methyltransferase
MRANSQWEERLVEARERRARRRSLGERFSPEAGRFTLREAPRDLSAELASDIAAGLAREPKSLPCRHFYDEEGSLLFEAICELPEYYLTRAEREILGDRKHEIVEGFSEVPDVVEFGSGSAEKTGILLAELARRGPVRYQPIDVSKSAILESSVALLSELPTLRIDALVGDYEDGISILGRPKDAGAFVVPLPRPSRNGAGGQPRLVLFLGSNIGNSDRTAAAGFLHRIAERLSRNDAILVGIDLAKARDVLEAAYDDQAGVTARFNKNLLVRANAELGGNFDVEAFDHRARYDEAEGRMQMFLVSRIRQRVRLDRLGREFEFFAGEAIHTEDSYKYSPAEIAELAQRAGLRIEKQWLDSEKRFSLNLFRP